MLLVVLETGGKSNKKAKLTPKYKYKYKQWVRSTLKVKKSNVVVWLFQSKKDIILSKNRREDVFLLLVWEPVKI